MDQVQKGRTWRWRISSGGSEKREFSERKMYSKEEIIRQTVQEVTNNSTPNRVMKS